MKLPPFYIKLALVVINLLFLSAIIHIFYSDYLRSRILDEKNNQILADKIVVKKSLRKL